MLSEYPNLRHLVELLDDYLGRTHPQFFGPNPTHPFLPVKTSKIIHDPLWGTNRFSWRELAIIDSPIMQRLRYIHQTGLAFHVYPAARHSRFEHSLGVLTIASRIFESLFERYPGDLLTIAKELGGDNPIQTLECLKQELRLAALLHDTGHSLFSHASEKVYSRLRILKVAAEELSDIAGKEKGSGEVISFCLAQTKSVAGLLERAKQNLTKGVATDDLNWNVSLNNISLLIVGASRHPHLQFMGDIISSGLDADKLDYLLRDAATAGLPMRYDLERYLHTVTLQKDFTLDPDGNLERLYRSVGTKLRHRPPVPGKMRYQYFDTYRLLLPQRATSTMEQIVICKIMLYSYIYHHQKVRAAEGLLEKLLTAIVDRWQKAEKSDDEILLKFMDFDDRSIMGEDFLRSADSDVSQFSYRLANRILPREVYHLSPAVSHAEGELLQEFFLTLKERDKRLDLVRGLEASIGSEMLRIDKNLASDSAEALWKTGTWVDAPKTPEVEEVELSGGEYPRVTIENVFPVEEWTEAYRAHRYFVRIYCFSEHYNLVAQAAKEVVGARIGIKTDDFFESCQHNRK
jgi:HD superfamily phosphohydrolase